MEVFRALAALSEAPGPAHSRIADILGLSNAPDAAAHTETFVLQLYPYASVYLGAEGAMGGEARDRVAGFWRALGLTPPTEPDHLATLLALFATLGDHESTEQDPARKTLWRHSRKSLFWEHLGCWVFAYLDKMEEIGAPSYREWARVTRTALAEAASELGPPDRLPLHLRDAPPLPDPRVDGSAPFLDGLLAMARSGMLLTQTDFVLGARTLGLAARVGDRRFLTKTLMGQDPVATMDWLAREADAWVLRHGARVEVSEEIAGFWTGRAKTSAALLRDLRDEAAIGEGT